MTSNGFVHSEVALLASPPSADASPVHRAISLEPKAWWEWQCPSCQSTFEHTGSCPQCHEPLRRTQVSLPFIWIG